MPTYEILREHCKFRKKEAVFPCSYMFALGGRKRFARQIRECKSKDEECAKTGCKYAGGTEDPLARE